MYERNPRKNDAAIEAVANSIRAFGFRQPVVVDKENVIVVGHTRWKAAQKLGLQKIPVHVATDLTPEQAKAYRIADNQTNTIAEWDAESLPLELKDLELVNFDLGLLGFSDEQLTEMLAPPENEGLCDPDEIPQPPDKAITQPGDLWLLGEHRLLCGDSGSPVDLDRLLDGAQIHLVNSDPPYNVNVTPRSNNARAAGSNALPAVAKKKAHLQGFDDARQGKPKATDKKLRAKDRVLANDFMSTEAFDKVLIAWFGNMARALKPGGAFYVWGGFANWQNYCRALEACGLYFSQGITWVKDHPVLGRKDFMNDCEHAWYGWREGAGHKFYGPNNARNVWHVKKVNPQSMVHLTEKPVELAARAIQYSSRKGENVLDLFGGSGSTLIAAEQQGRRAFLMELDPLYADIIVQRWEQFTGKKAKRIIIVIVSVLAVGSNDQESIFYQICNLVDGQLVLCRNVAPASAPQRPSEVLNSRQEDSFSLREISRLRILTLLPIGRFK
jgi:DNA modification methylase